MDIDRRSQPERRFLVSWFGAGERSRVRYPSTQRAFWRPLSRIEIGEFLRQGAGPVATLAAKGLGLTAVTAYLRSL
jgi:hypothetical protein